MRSIAIKIDPDILGGTPCFAGTRVPVKTLFDFLENGDSLDIFLDEFPSVRHDQAVALLEESHQSVTRGMRRVLLDESVPRRFGFELEGRFVRTVQFMG